MDEEEIKKLPSQKVVPCFLNEVRKHFEKLKEIYQKYKNYSSWDSYTGRYGIGDFHIKMSVGSAPHLEEFSIEEQVEKSSKCYYFNK